MNENKSIDIDSGLHATKIFTDNRAYHRCYAKQFFSFKGHFFLFKFSYSYGVLFSTRKLSWSYRCIRKIADPPCQQFFYLLIFKTDVPCVYHLLRSVARSQIFRLRYLRTFYNQRKNFLSLFLFYRLCSFNNVIFP